MRAAIKEVFQALIELIGPLSSILFGVALYSIPHFDLPPGFPLPIPFTGVSISAHTVRDVLLGGYMLLQWFLTASLYRWDLRSGPNGGRKFIEVCFSLVPLGAIFWEFWDWHNGSIRLYQDDFDTIFASIMVIAGDFIGTVVVASALKAPTAPS